MRPPRAKVAVRQQLVNVREDRYTRRPRRPSLTFPLLNVPQIRPTRLGESPRSFRGRRASSWARLTLLMVRWVFTAAGGGGGASAPPPGPSPSDLSSVDRAPAAPCALLLIPRPDGRSNPALMRSSGSVLHLSVFNHSREKVPFPVGGRVLGPGVDQNKSHRMSCSTHLASPLFCVRSSSTLLFL